jgi:hypothetical protein
MRIIETTSVLALGFVLACAKAPPEERRAAAGDSVRPAGAPVGSRATALDSVHLGGAPVSSRATGQCGDVSGYLDDPAPRGRAVYAAPDTQSPVLGRILPPVLIENRGWPVSFAIHEARDGWLLVEHAGDDSVLTETAPRPMYSGRGWIRGNGVSVGVQASQAFAAPRHASALVVQADPAHTLEGGATMMTEVFACEGDWVLARWQVMEPRGLRYADAAVVTPNPLVVQGWVTGICNIQETSCDQPSGDRPDSARAPAAR